MQTAMTIGGLILMGAAVGAVVWKAIRFLVHASEAIALVAKELVPNEGTTLRDAVDRLEASDIVATKERHEATARYDATNGSTTLRDMVNGLAADALHARNERQQMNEDIEQIRYDIQAYIVDRRPGGRRGSDPQQLGE